MNDTAPTGDGTGRFWLLLFIALVLLGWALHATSAFAIPITFAFFVALAVSPVDRRVAEWAPRGGRWLGHAAAMLVLIVLLGIFFAGIGLAAREVLQKFPGSIAQDVSQAIDGATGPASETAPVGSGGQVADGQRTTGTTRGASGEGGGSGDAQAAAEGPAEPSEDGVMARIGSTKAEIGNLLRERVTGYAGTIVNRTATFFLSLILVLFLALFLLIEGPRWEQKARTLLSPRHEAEWMTAIEKTASGVRRFVVVRAVLGLVTALLYVGWLAIWGLDLLLVWGVITFLLNFIPTIGSLISGLLATGYAFYQLGLWQAAMVGLGVLVIEQVMGNYVDPRFLGRQLSLSGFVVLAFLLVWGWMWGFAGALLSTPILIFVVNVAAHVPSLRPLAVLLSESGEQSVRAITDGEPAGSFRS